MRLNAKDWYKQKATIITLGLIVFLLVLSLIAGRWFQVTHVGWLIESVQAPNRMYAQWQSAVDSMPESSHPAVIHLLPNDCLCTILTLKHAKSVSVKANVGGFSVFQVATQHQGLGESIDLMVPKLSPFIAITDDQGRIKYLGAYSDGVRCTTANSLVDAFVESSANLPGAPVIGLDVQVCRCLNNESSSI